MWGKRVHPEFTPDPILQLLRTRARTGHRIRTTGSVHGGGDNEEERSRNSGFFAHQPSLPTAKQAAINKVAPVNRREFLNEFSSRLRDKVRASEGAFTVVSTSRNGDVSPHPNLSN